MSSHHVRSVGEAAEGLALGFDTEVPHRARAFANLVDRAAEAHGIALHYAGDDPDADEQAMHQALLAVSRGFAAATMESLARDEELALSTEQKAAWTT